MIKVFVDGELVHTVDGEHKGYSVRDNKSEQAHVRLNGSGVIDIRSDSINESDLENRQGAPARERESNKAMVDRLKKAPLEQVKEGRERARKARIKAEKEETKKKEGSSSSSKKSTTSKKKSS